MDVKRILAVSEDIITPFAVVDEEIVERNLARMAKLAAVQELVRASGDSRFRGLISHGGHVYAATNQEERQRAADQESESVSITAEMLRHTGIEVRELSIGSTPTAGLALRRGITEMRP